MATIPNREPLADAVNALLWAIDGGYFDEFLKTSAFVTAVRIAYEAETGKSGYPRGEQVVLRQADAKQAEAA